MPYRNIIGELANRLQREGRVADLESEFTRLDRASLSAAEREAWWHLYGIAAFQEGRHAEALERFKRGYELFPTSAQMRFSLGQEYEHAFLQAELRAYRAGQPAMLVAPLEQRLRELPAGSFPTGYTRLCLAVARARASSTASDAEATVNHVVLGAQDFPWLEDMRILATAEVAHRFGRRDVERGRVAAFLARQPMLFEPDIALSFHLLEYQESLKLSYRNRDISQGAQANT